MLMRIMIKIREQLCTVTSAQCWIEENFASKSLSSHILVRSYGMSELIIQYLILTQCHRTTFGLVCASSKFLFLCESNRVFWLKKCELNMFGGGQWTWLRGSQRVNCSCLNSVSMHAVSHNLRSKSFVYIYNIYITYTQRNSLHGRKTTTKSRKKKLREKSTTLTQRQQRDNWVCFFST